MAKVVMLFAGLAILAGCATPEPLRESFAKQGYVSEAALQGGYVNTPFMRYMDQRDAERRVAREIADELERRSIQQ